MIRLTILSCSIFFFFFFDLFLFFLFFTSTSASTAISTARTLRSAMKSTSSDDRSITTIDRELLLSNSPKSSLFSSSSSLALRKTPDFVCSSSHPFAIDVRKSKICKALKLREREKTKPYSKSSSGERERERTVFKILQAMERPILKFSTVWIGTEMKAVGSSCDAFDNKIRRPSFY